MSAPAKLESSSNGQRPLFYPGQVLSDAALSGIATFARSGLAAESQRHGWGIIFGLFPSANSDGVTISRGMVAGQDGQLFVLDDSPTIKLTELLSEGEQVAAAASGEAIHLDLWLSIGVEQVGRALPFRKIGVAAGFAPVVTPPATPDGSRPSRENLIACLELRAVSKLEKCLNDEGNIVRTFEADFNKEAMTRNPGISYQEGMNKIRACHAEALAKLYSLDQVKYGGIPLGRVTVAVLTEGPRVVLVDCGVARREQAPLLLPSKPDYINSTALFGLKCDEAVNWLARHGIPTWTKEALTDQSVQQHMSGDPQFLCWDVELRAGTTARLYTNEGRIALVKQGPVVAEEFKQLLNRIEAAENEQERLSKAVVFLFLLLIIAAAILAFAIYWK
ncbi:hypothetical protein [Rhizobium leguminosarum]|uniref:hypothetical protein n=1 Tax=Rhizobium leguminosarum TaxID=384 RepID=UPI00047FF4B3|nr:hypothetical protein [Rhizobium leguminosarum]